MHSPIRVPTHAALSRRAVGNLLLGLVLFGLLVSFSSVATAQDPTGGQATPTLGISTATPSPLDSTATPTLSETAIPPPTDDTTLPTDTPTVLATEVPTDAPTVGVTETDTPIPSDTPTPLPTDTTEPTVAPTDSPTSDATTTPEPTLENTVTPTETEIATETETPVPSETVIILPSETPIPLPTETPAPSPTLESTPIIEPGVAQGKIHLQGNPSNDEITVVSDSGTSVTLNESNAFQLSLPPGSYILTASRPGYLSAQHTVSIESNQTVRLPAVTLFAGDANHDGAVDISDATLVASSFGDTDTGKADLNGDGVVNILDLVLVNSNFGRQGPQDW